MQNQLEGQLSEDVLGNLLQYLSLNVATGCLQVRRPPNLVSEVFFEQGRVIHVSTGNKIGIPALAVLMNWHNGSFKFRTGIPAPQRTINLSLDSLLLEAAYHADVASMSAEFHAMLDEESVLTPKAIAAGQNVTLTLRAIQLLRFFDGKLNLRELAERMSMGMPDVLGAASELLNHNLVAVTASPVVPAGFIKDLTQVSLDIMGPMGEIVIEDALYDLSLDPNSIPENHLPDLLKEVRNQFKRPEWRSELENQIRRLCEKYNVRLR